ncbi:MAG: class I SAM-dependent methyltransferase [Thermoplasmata archaeon]|nr:class I SAM-dependent methyltransferase [Thermoplasmata archaeon]
MSQVAMPELDVVDAFDQISPVYDATRAPLDEASLDSVAGSLKARGVRSILEVGVGTGRVAIPLAARGFQVTGIDASTGMLGRARSKGASRLVRGTAYALPFRGHAVDTTLFVHVLHLLDDPRAALREACRVGRLGATALVRPPNLLADPPAPELECDPRRVVAEILARDGHVVATRGATGEPGRRESKLMRSIPPDRLEVLSDRTVTEPLSERLDLLQPGSSRAFLQVPPDALRRAVDEARRQVGDRTRTRRRVEALATWAKAPERVASVENAPSP